MRRISALIAVTVFSVSLLTGCTGATGTKQQDTIQNTTKVTTSQQDKTIQAEEKKEYIWKGTLYFSDTNAMYIGKEEREMKAVADSTGKIDTAAKAKIMLEEMIKGPKSKELSASIPKNTKVKSVVFDKDIAVVDLSKEFIDDNPGGSAGEIMAIAPIILLLTDFEDIKQVSIKINGQQQTDFKGHYTLDKPIKRAEFEQYLNK